jgi:GH25 family lysozyme M1 (1,4-beta-N-acetylmuramidase)
MGLPGKSHFFPAFFVKSFWNNVLKTKKKGAILGTNVEKTRNMGRGENMKKKRLLGILLSAVMATSLLGGCASRTNVTEDMIPTVTDLRNENVQEEAATVMGLTMNMSYVAELTRLDGDNTELASVDAKTVPVVLKATSLDKDLKIKIVNQKNDRVITGTVFEVTVTDADKKITTYKDDDKDGIIYIKNMTPGKCTVSMKSSGSYSAAQDITAEVKASLEYKVVDVVDEIKKESEINVAKEETNTTGNSTAGTATVLTDTVEYVASTQTAVTEDVKTQKTDEFGQLMYSKQLTDKYGTPMYARILSEPASDHTDANGDNTCDRCGANLKETSNNEGNNGGTTDTNPDGNGEKKEETSTPAETSLEGEQVSSRIIGRGLQLVAAAASEKIVYDTSSAPVYDTSSEPVYEITQKTTGYKYTGWQTIDGATYYFDKNGNKVTGTQVIQGIQYTFSSEGVRSGTIGIDVSKWQTNINWKKVKAAGINFVMIRCGYRGYGSGVLVEDSMYASHISGAKAAGLRVGVYFFSQAITEAEAVEEASMAVKLAARYGINMPIAIDSEYANGGSGRADKLSKSERTKITVAFCNTVKSAGYTPMVYASKAWFSDHLNVSQLSSYRIWVAHYATTCGYTGRYDIWQNTSKGQVDGVSGYVDMNISSI